MSSSSHNDSPEATEADVIEEVENHLPGGERDGPGQTWPVRTFSHLWTRGMLKQLISTNLDAEKVEYNLEEDEQLRFFLVGSGSDQNQYSVKRKIDNVIYLWSFQGTFPFHDHQIWSISILFLQLHLWVSLPVKFSRWKTKSVQLTSSVSFHPFANVAY